MLGLVFWLGGAGLVRLMSADPQVQAMALTYLPWVMLTPLFQVAAMMFDGIFIGATRSGDMRNMMAVSALIYAGVLALALAPLGNHGLWLAFQVSFLARGLTLALRYPALERSVMA